MLALFLSLTLFSQCSKEDEILPEMNEISFFGDNPGKLDAYLHIPPNAVPGMPLMIVLHGCSQTAKDAAELTGWNELADSYGFYVLYPEQKVINNGSRCFNWFLEKDYQKNSGENASIKNMMSYVQAKYHLNALETYITGLSAGAAMSTIMIADYPELFKGAAVLSGGPYKSAENIAGSFGALAGNVDKSPEEWGDLVRAVNPAYQGTYPKLMIFHGKNDAIVDFKNCNELIEQWSNVLNISMTDTSVTHPQTDIARIAYLDALQVEQIIAIEVDNMGHALLVDPGSGVDQGGGKGIFAEDKNYFSSYWIAKQFDLVP